MSIGEGTPVLICLDDDQTFLVLAEAGKKLHTHRGVIDLGALLGQEFGFRLAISQGWALVLKPTIEDLMMKLKRKTAIVYPKDAGMVLLKIGATPGARILEVGTGSGGMTIALAGAVAPDGRIFSYDARPEFIDLARRNLERSGLSARVEFHARGEKGAAFHESGVDAAVLDVPAPWEELPAVRNALRDGGRLASLNPSYNQIETMAEALRETGFVMVEAMEILYRKIQARRGKTRPLQWMVGHTEFLLFAVKAPGDLAHPQFF